jgi:hypothetical protein
LQFEAPANKPVIAIEIKSRKPDDGHRAGEAWGEVMADVSSEESRKT